MRHKKRYKKTGNGVALMCGDKIIASSPYRNSNFSMKPCECGMTVETIGTSPETDIVKEQP